MSESAETVALEVPASQVRVVVACLVLGTIERIAAGTLAPGDGLWSLARPNFGRSPGLTRCYRPPLSRH